MLCASAGVVRQSVKSIAQEFAFDSQSQSFINPTLKSGDNRVVENYEAISIVSPTSKIFEIVILKKLTPLICPQNRHDFVAGTSTMTNLLCYCCYI